MNIGLVLASTPGYSETFFTSKIKGLKAQGMSVYLFTRGDVGDFDLCTVISAKKISRNPFFQGLRSLLVFIQLVPRYGTVKRFIQLERMQGNSWKQVYKKLYLNAHILSKQLDWVHFGFATLSVGSENVACSMKAKMGVSFRGFDIAIYPHKFPNCYDLLWRRVDKVHTISDDLLNRAYELGLSREVPVQKITPAIDISVFSEGEKHFTPVKGKVKILTVARLNWKKGFVEVIQALDLLKKEGYDFSYTIVGKGKEEERIAYAVHQLGLSSHVQFVGMKNREEVIRLYSESDIYVQYSISEGFCNAVIEAQSMGLLCIVSNAEGLAENVLNDASGWVVPKYNIDALAKKMIEVVSLSEAAKQTISVNAKKRVREIFTIEEQQKKFVDFYRKTN